MPELFAKINTITKTSQTPYSLSLALFISEPLEGVIGGGGGLIQEAYLFVQKPAMEIISVNYNKLKIITKHISYNNDTYGGGGSLEKGGLIRERGAYSRGSLIRERGAYLRDYGKRPKISTGFHEN